MPRPAPAGVEDKRTARKPPNSSTPCALPRFRGRSRSGRGIEFPARRAWGHAPLRACLTPVPGRPGGARRPRAGHLAGSGLGRLRGRGGKSFLLAERSIQVWASDISMRRLMGLRSEQVRLGVALPAFAASATEPPLKRPPGTVLLDAPCSGLGVLSRRPDIKWKRTPRDIPGLSSSSHACSCGARPPAAGRPDRLRDLHPESGRERTPGPAADRPPPRNDARSRIPHRSVLPAQGVLLRCSFEEGRKGG
jgi:hypothetical protein